MLILFLILFIILIIIPTHQDIEFSPEDLALATVPGYDFDPKHRSFHLEELRPQPIIRYIVIIIIVIIVIIIIVIIVIIIIVIVVIIIVIILIILTILDSFLP